MVHKIYSFSIEGLMYVYENYDRYIIYFISICVKGFVNFLIKNSGNCSINEAGFLKLSKNIPFCSINILISI